MKNLLALVALCFLYSLNAAAEVIQVPENCLDSTSKDICLVRAVGSSFDHQYKNFNFRLERDSILRVSYKDGKNHFELISGYLKITNLKNKAQNLIISNYDYQLKKELYISKSNALTSMLDVATFYSTNLSKDGEVTSSNFISKIELVNKLKYFFSDTVSFKKYLNKISVNWQVRFNEETASQTKILSRSIASVQQKELQIKKANQEKLEQIKKIKNEFFYRTFER